MADFELVWLWSDILILVLLVTGIVWFAYAWTREYWRDAFVRIARNRSAMLSLGIVIVYAAIALVDSVHYRPVTIGKDGQRTPGAVQSALDRLAKPLLLTKQEKTFSAPFASQSFSKETYVDESGRKGRRYPTLKHGGQHLKEGETLSGDIMLRFFQAAAFAALLGMLVWLVATFFLRKFVKEDQKRRGWQQRTTMASLFVAAVSLVLLGAILLSEGYHVFGTDKTGVDVFYVAIKSIRTGMIIGILTTLIVTPFAIVAGTLAGYLGGWVDDLVQYLYTTLSSIPGILLIAAAMLILKAKLHSLGIETIFSADLQLVFLCLILGITSWTGLARLIRGEALKLKKLEYVQAAKAFGVNKMMIMVRHLVPNLMHIVLITVVLNFSNLVLAESVLAYVGIGVDPSMHSWGNMINNARLELAREPVVWWNLLAAFVFMFGLVLPANIFGDAVRDALDPRLRGEE